MATCYLDEYILTEILVRLPAKSLLRFKCVCRRWHSLISDHSSTKAHLRLSLDESPNPPQRLRIRDRPHLSVKITRACDGWEDRLVGNSCLRKRRKREDAWHRVVGSCRGLLCIQFPERRFLLYNPTTGDSKELPTPLHYCFPIFGLGYDALSDDFKFIMATADVKGAPMNKFDIYSLKSDSWRSLGEVNDYHIADDVYGNYSNGKLYWRNCMSKTGCTIVSFNLGMEKFCQNLLAMPSFGLGHGHPILTSSEGGWLFAYQGYSSGTLTEVWIMKDCPGLNPTWTKLCNFSTERIYNHKSRPYYLDMHPVIKDGRVVILCVQRGERRVGVYDPEEDSWKTFMLPQPLDHHSHGKITCAESLVSLRT